MTSDAKNKEGHGGKMNGHEALDLAETVSVVITLASR